MEYLEDIELYYKTGPGTEINSVLACATVADLIEHLTDPDRTEKTIVSFADATSIQLFLTALGTHNDTLRPSNVSLENMENRKWKSSETSPFASNLAVVKYVCETEEEDEERVKLFLNQKPLVLDWCDDGDGFCSLIKFVEHYKSFRDADCTKYFCGLTSGTESLVHGSLAIVLGIVFLYLL